MRACSPLEHLWSAISAFPEHCPSRLIQWKHTSVSPICLSIESSYADIAALECGETRLSLISLEAKVTDSVAMNHRWPNALHKSCAASYGEASRQ